MWKRARKLKRIEKENYSALELSLSLVCVFAFSLFLIPKGNRTKTQPPLSFLFIAFLIFSPLSCFNLSPEQENLITNLQVYSHLYLLPLSASLFKALYLLDCKNTDRLKGKIWAVFLGLLAALLGYAVFSFLGGWVWVFSVIIFEDLSF